MGRMKDLYIEICNANNGGIPRDLTIADAARMKELEIYEWEQYEKEMENIRLQRAKEDNPSETKKMEFAERKFRRVHKEDED
jgi:hypothetical protein